MVVLTIPGRMIHEEHWCAKLGAPIKPMITAFKLLDKDIWLISAKVLTPEEQKELRSLIRSWRRQHPKQLIFSYIRGMLADAQKTLTAGNDLMASTNSTLKTTSDLVARLSIDPSATNGRPIDMVALTGAVEQLNTMVASLGQLLESPGWEQRFPQLL